MSRTRLRFATVGLALLGLCASPPRTAGQAVLQLRPGPTESWRKPSSAVRPVELVRYVVRFPNAVHHEAEIEASFPAPADEPLRLRMSRSSPGRYALHEFAKNVYRVRATGEDGRSLPVRRPDPYEWHIPRHGARVTVRYTLFADRADGTYSQVDRSHAHLNMPSAFLWAIGLQEHPIEVRFEPPDATGWKVATQLFPTTDPLTFTAPDLRYFMDSPTELSDFDLREWEVDSGGHRSTIRFAVHHRGTPAEVDAYVADVKKIVRQEIAVFGETPAYEGGTYTFIADYLPWASGDGMEHRNSTILTSSGSLAANASRLLRSVSHEYFHSWNVERLRPRALEPFDFTRANMSGELWFAEGFTSYYTSLLLRRAGLLDDAGYARAIAAGLNVVLHAPGRRLFSPVEMSMQAPFVDAATSVDPTNRANTFISYYTWGSVLGLGLDLSLRARFSRTLDDYLRLLWRRHGKPEIPYTLDDLEAALAEVTGNGEFAAEFFRRFVQGREVLDYASLLARAGFRLGPAHPGRAVLGGVRLDYGPEGATLRSGTLVGSPLYEAGLDRGDTILRVDGRPLTSGTELAGVLEAHRPGDEVEIVFRQRGQGRTAALTLAEDPTLEVVPHEAAGLPLTPEQRAFRRAWLAGAP
ncbi:MAG: M61 family metallopeptidase [Gemmatimonadota bacterium]